MAKRKSTKDKQRSTKHTYKTKDRVTRTPLKTGGEHMNKMQQETNDQLRTQDVQMDVWINKHEKGYNSRKNQPSVKSL